jgi:O-antigen/teichoic acid export membrane protein
VSVLEEREVAPLDPGAARRILWNTAYPLVANLGGKVATIALYVVMARELGASSFGIFTFGMAFAMIVTTLADFEQDKILTREVARDRARVDFYFPNTLGLKLALAVPAVALGAGVLVLAGAGAEKLEVVLVLSAAVVAELLMATCFATFQSFERLELVPVALLSQRFVTAGVGVAALLLGVGVVGVSVVYLGGALLGLGLAAGPLLRRVVRPRLRLEPRRLWSLMRAALAIGLAGVFTIILFRVDTAMLAAFESDAVVGNYGVAYRLFETTLFLSWSVGAALYPVFSRLTPASRPSVGFVFERGIKLIVALTLPLAAGAAVLAEPLVELLFGTAYDEAPTALVILAPAIALYPVCYLAGYLLVSQDQQRWLTIVYGVAAAVNVLLNLVLIPWQSLYGAALGTSISQLLVAVALLSLAHRSTGSVGWTRALAGPVLATALAAAAMAALAGTLGLAVAAGAAVYLAVLAVFERVVFPEDFAAAAQFVRRRRDQA